MFSAPPSPPPFVPPPAPQPAPMTTVTGDKPARAAQQPTFIAAALSPPSGPLTGSQQGSFVGGGVQT